MAECLIYNKENNHVWDVGDIVEVRPNGYWLGKEGKGFNKEIFAVMRIDIDYNEIEMLLEAKYSKGNIEKRRKYKLDDSIYEFSKLREEGLDHIIELDNKIYFINKDIIMEKEIDGVNHG